MSSNLFLPVQAISSMQIARRFFVWTAGTGLIAGLITFVCYQAHWDFEPIASALLGLEVLLTARLAFRTDTPRWIRLATPLVTYPIYWVLLGLVMCVLMAGTNFIPSFGSWLSLVFQIFPMAPFISNVPGSIFLPSCAVAALSCLLPYKSNTASNIKVLGCGTNHSIAPYVVTNPEQ